MYNNNIMPKNGKRNHFIVIGALICTLFIFMLFSVLVIPYEKFDTKEKTSKIIWTYWDNPDNVDPLVNLCQKNWKKHAPNYEMRFVTQNNIEDYVKMPDNWISLEPYRQSDVFRLLAIEKYGGVWLDASIMLTANPDTFVNPDDCTFFSVPVPPHPIGEYPILENWCFAAPPNNPIIKKWREEVMIALENKTQYISNSEKRNTESIGGVDYLICHLCLKNVYDKNKELFEHVTIYNSNETAFHQHNKYNWDNVGVNVLHDKKFDIDPKEKMVKFRGPDRHGVDSSKVDSSWYE
jgi:hypothetical protein